MANNSNQIDSSQVLAQVFDRESDTLAVRDSDDIKNIDEVDSTTTYIGWARPGTADITTAWRICRIEVIGTVTKIRWAEGTSEYVNSWSARAALNYS